MTRPLLAALTAALLAAAVPAPAAAFDWIGKVERAAEGLRSTDPVKRREAVKDLGAYDIEMVKRYLLQAMRDTDPQVRSQAAKLLAAHKVAEAVPIVIDWLDDPDSDTKKDAAETLSKIGTPQAVAALVRTLGDVDPDVRLSAVIALGKIGGASVVVPLIARVETDSEPKQEVRRAAVEALGKIGDPRAVIPMVGAFDDTIEVRVAAVGAVGQLGDLSAVPALLRLLNDQEIRVRREAIKSLGQLRAAAAVGPLIEQLTRDSGDVQYGSQVAVALGQIAAGARDEAARRRAVVALVEALGRAQLRTGVMEAIKVAGDSAVPVLIDHLEGRTPGDPESAVRLLRDLRDRRATPALVAELSRGRVGHELVLDALARAADPRALLPVLGLLSSPDDLLRQQAMTALRELIGPGARAADIIVRMLADPVLDIRIMAAEYLGIIGSPVAVDPLLRVVAEAPENRLRGAAVTALGRIGDRRAARALLGVLGSGPPALQGLAADALMDVGGPDAAGPLLQMIGDPRGPRLEAARALGGVLRGRRDDRSRQALEKLADGDSLPVALAAIAALGAMGDPAAGPALQELARSYNPHRQRAAVEALGNLGDRGAVPLLIDLLAAGDDRVASAAAWALGKLGDPRAVAPLLAAVPRRGWGTAANASAALALLAPRDAGKPLLALLRHRDRLVRINVAHALAAAGVATAAAPLGKQLAADPSPLARIAAARALSRLPRTESTAAALKAASGDSDPSVRAAAAAALERPFAPPKRTDWQAFRFVDPGQADAPVRQEAYFIVAADGLATALYTDERGEATEERFPPGPYLIEPLSGVVSGN